MAIDIAKQLHCHIISADSRQLYREIPIVTAAPDPQQLAEVPHHFVGCTSVADTYSAARYESEVMALLPLLYRDTPYAILCGGSMMYIDAVMWGLDPQPEIPAATREQVTAVLRRHGIGALQQWLLELDPEYYTRVELSNPARLVHAIEVSIVARRPYSSLLRGEKARRPFDVVMIAPEWQRATLFDRINSRVDAMLLAGLEEEARRMYPQRHLQSLNTVGLREMFAYFDGTMSRSAAIARIAKNTRVYAKKQLTWMRKYDGLHRLDASQDMVRPAMEIISSQQRAHRL